MSTLTVLSAQADTPNTDPCASGSGQGTELARSYFWAAQNQQYLQNLSIERIWGQGWDEHIANNPLKKTNTSHSRHTYIHLLPGHICWISGGRMSYI